MGSGTFGRGCTAKGEDCRVGAAAKTPRIAKLAKGCKRIGTRQKRHTVSAARGTALARDPRTLAPRAARNRLEELLLVAAPSKGEDWRVGAAAKAPRTAKFAKLVKAAWRHAKSFIR